MSRQKELIAHLLDAFPPKPFNGQVVSHDHPECAELHTSLGGASWWSIPGHVIQQHAGHLPLLTKDAYKAFLPAWMCEAASDPTGPAAAQLMASLREGRFASNFSEQESYAVIQVAKWIAEKNGTGPEDPASAGALSEIVQKWGPG